MPRQGGISGKDDPGRCSLHILSPFAFEGQATTQNGDVRQFIAIGAQSIPNGHELFYQFLTIYILTELVVVWYNSTVVL